VSLSEALGTELSSLRDRELASVGVAILDTGIDSSHPDLRDRVIHAFEVERVGRRFRVAQRPLPGNYDRMGHGTGVSSTVAAIAPNARLIDIQVVGADQVGSGEALLAGLSFALECGFPLLNMSVACHRRLLEPLTELCEFAYFRNQVIVAARRNMPLIDNGIPAEFSSCIGAQEDRFPTPYQLRFRDRHPIEFGAQGEGIVVAAPGGKYTLQTGASYATSTLTGLCALILGAFPALTPFELKTVLKGHAVS
jgi:subtilisin family serine protease